ncbi:MAG: sigma-70 family RNA polymerase sigma factor [Candidatus Saccharimonadales bacterium]
MLYPDRRPPSPSGHEFELIPEQVEALDALDLTRREGDRSCYINMATGVGKTIVAALDVKSFLEEQPGARVLYLCHKGGILRQAQETFEKELPEVSHGRLYAGHEGDQADIVYATFQTMNGRFAGGRKYEALSPEEFDYVVVDESHHGPAETYQDVIEYFKPQFLLGMTGTPNRRDRISLSHLFGKEKYAFLLEDAIAKGRLAKPDYRVLTDHVRKLGEIQTDIGKLSLGKLNREIFVPRRDGEIADMIAEHLYEVEDPRTLVFCPTIEYAEHITDFLPGNVATLHSNLSPQEQEDRLAAFKRGDLDMLTVVDMLNEGVDVPEINVLVFLRSTESETVFLQQLGRGLRNKDSVLVLDFVASYERISMVRDLRDRVTKHFKLSQQSESAVKTSAPFQFDFSEEALNAIDVVKRARVLRALRPTSNKIKRLLSPAELVREMLHGRIPDQSTSYNDQVRFISRFKKGDKVAAGQFLAQRLSSMYAAAEHYSKHDPEAVEDYFQELCANFLEKITSFDSKSYGGDIISYAASLSQGAMRHAQSRARIIDVPRTSINQAENVIKARDKLERIMDRLPDEDLVLEQAGIVDEEEVKMFKRIQALLDPDTLDKAVDVIDEDEYIDPEVMGIASTESQNMRALIRFLPQTERNVLMMRYGLSGEAPKNLNEIGPKLGFSAERASQLEQRALTKLISMIVDLKVTGSAAVVKGKQSIVISPSGEMRAEATSLGYKVYGKYAIEALTTPEANQTDDHKEMLSRLDADGITPENWRFYMPSNFGQPRQDSARRGNHVRSTFPTRSKDKY